MTSMVFPQAPAIAAEWMPVFLEPIVGSGERMVVAIACRSPNTEPLVTTTLAESTLQCLYGTSDHRVASIIAWITESLQDHLARSDSLLDWEPPLSGVHRGRKYEGMGDSLQDIARQAATMVCSFADLDSFADIVTVQDKDSHRSEQWSALVRAELERIRPALVRYLNRPVQIGEKRATIRYGFLAESYAANFGRFIPDQLKHSADNSKARLLDLVSLRDSDWDAGIFGKPELYELVVKMPDFGNPAISSDRLRATIAASEILQERADGSGIGLIKVDDASAVANHLSQRVAA